MGSWIAAPPPIMYQGQFWGVRTNLFNIHLLSSPSNLKSNCNV